MGCEGRVNFEAVVASGVWDLGVESVAVFQQYLAIAASVKSATIKPTREYLEARLKLSPQQVKTANKRLVKAGFISRQSTNKPTNKVATTTILNLDTFLYSATTNLTTKATADVGVGVTAVRRSLGVDVIPVVLDTAKREDGTAPNPGAHPPQVAPQNETEKPDPTPHAEFQKLYNATCPKLVHCLSMSDARKRIFKAAWRRHPDMGYWKNILTMANKSEFLSGLNPRTWTADIEFVIRGHEKIAEGKYNEKKFYREPVPMRRPVPVVTQEQMEPVDLDELRKLENPNWKKISANHQRPTENQETHKREVATEAERLAALPV